MPLRCLGGGKNFCQASWRWSSPVWASSPVVFLSASTGSSLRKWRKGLWKARRGCAGFGFLLLVSILRCCGCCQRTKSPRGKPQASGSGYPVAANASGVLPRAGLPPRPPQPLQAEGVTYDGGSGQFIVNGRPYGQYQGYQHGRTPSTAPLVR